MAGRPEGDHLLFSEHQAGFSSNLVHYQEDITVTVKNNGLADFKMPGYSAPEIELSLEEENPYKLEYGENKDIGVVLVSGRHLHEIIFSKYLSTSSVSFEMYGDIQYAVTKNGKSPLIPDHPYVFGRYTIHGDDFSTIEVPGIGRDNYEMALILKQFGNPNNPYVYYLLEKINRQAGIWIDRDVRYNDHVGNVSNWALVHQASQEHPKICYDAVGVDNQGKFFINADGIADSRKAAGVAVDIFTKDLTILSETLNNLSPEERYWTAQESILASLDNTMIKAGMEMKMHLGGTTLLAYYLENGFLYGVHAGDSRFYQYRKELDKLFLNTRDEIELTYLIFSLCDGDEFRAMPIVDEMFGVMNNATTLKDLENKWQSIFRREKFSLGKNEKLTEYWHRRHQIKNALTGSRKDKKTFSITTVNPGDRLLFTTDGIEAIRDETLESILRKAKDAEEAREMILQALNDIHADKNNFRIYNYSRKGKTEHYDDVSFIVAFVNEEGFIQKAFSKAKIIFS